MEAKMVDSNQDLHTPFSRQALSRAPWLISSLLSLVLIIVCASLTLGLPPGQGPTAQGPPDPVLIKVTPTSLRFGYQPARTSSPSRSVRVTSFDQPVSIRGVSVTGNDSGHFILSGGGAAVVPMNSTHTIGVVFHPKPQVYGEMKMYWATLTIDGRFRGSPYRVPLLGTTFPGPAMSFSPGALGFGSQEVLTRSAPRTVTITSIGGSDLVIRRVYCLNTPSSNPADFTIVGPGSSRTAFGDSITYSIVFTPTALYHRSCPLKFDSNKFGGSDSVNLTGFATPRK